MRYSIIGDSRFLEDIRRTLTEALNNEKLNMPDHVPHPRFECTFSDSDEPQAKAMLMGGVSVICITHGMLGLVWAVCDRLSKSEHIVQTFNHARPYQIHNALFQTLLASILCHEYVHHVHGHLAQPDSDIPSQVLEVDADSYAVYFALEFLIKGMGRAGAVERLNCADQSIEAQDRALLSSFILATGGFWHATATDPFNVAQIYQRAHPPIAARMNWIMCSAMSWCEQNKPQLKNWMTLEQWRRLMLFAAIAVAELGGNIEWGDQTNFLMSEQGIEYQAVVTTKLREYVRLLGSAPRPKQI
jgi:hypothetical protein